MLLLEIRFKDVVVHIEASADIEVAAAVYLHSHVQIEAQRFVLPVYVQLKTSGAECRHLRASRDKEFPTIAKALIIREQINLVQVIQTIIVLRSE